VEEKDASKALLILLNKIVRTTKPFKLNYGNDITKEGIFLNYLSMDGAMFPARFDMYKPAKNGIYNLAGNLAEWTLSSAFNHTDSSKILLKQIPNSEQKQIVYYYKSKGSEYYDTLNGKYIFYNNEEIKPLYEKDGYMAVKGGSWYHSIFYLQPSVSIYCNPNEQHSYIGFRPVMILVKKD